ncbi:zinc finger domain-containing protein [Saccharothrix hoggarensis]|uniref:Uncharacterized protein n=1 Tax=Saccharothrix hoggarensis TaxID=913853 RepID=A0ABW3QGD6_9PSEU
MPTLRRAHRRGDVPGRVRCPDCGAQPGRRRCVRPSEHETVLWHAARVAAAEEVDRRREEAGDLTLPAPWAPARPEPKPAEEVQAGQIPLFG